MLIITGISVSFLSFLYLKLSFKVIGYRYEHSVSMGDGGHKDLMGAIRAQANLAEYAPIGLLLLACLELNQAPGLLVSIFAAVFVIGRLIHPIGMGAKQHSWKPRANGMKLTFVSMTAMGITNLVLVGLHIYANLVR